MLRLGNTRVLQNGMRNARKIICFGAGKGAKKFEEAFKESEDLAKVILFVDNSKEKQGTELCFAGRSVDIVSLEELKNLNLKEAIFVITVHFATEYSLVKQIKSYTEFEAVDCYCFSSCHYFDLEDVAMAKKMPDSLRITEKPVIPKLIHYCWFGNNPIPNKYKEWMESWHKYCPDYEIIEWNESNYDISKNQYMQQAYESKKWGFVPDYARLDIIYNYGGIYLDTDVEIVQSFDELLYQNGFAGFESDFAVAFGLGFGAAKRLKIIKDLRDMYENLCFIKADGTLNMVASPILLTEYLVKKGLVCNGEYQIVNGLSVFPEKMFSGKSGVTRQTRLAAYTRAVHHYEGTWLNSEGKGFWNERDELTRMSGLN